VPDPTKTKAALLDSNKDYGHRFADVVHFLEATGWAMRRKGSHRIFIQPGVPALLNLQPDEDGKAKAYQVRQIRRALIQFDL
jgi:predicted RNA binding protein YcfA (HicA-like mRNA interferase family)